MNDYGPVVFVSICVCFPPNCDDSVAWLLATRWASSSMARPIELQRKEVWRRPWCFWRSGELRNFAEQMWDATLMKHMVNRLNKNNYIIEQPIDVSSWSLNLWTWGDGEEIWRGELGNMEGALLSICGGFLKFKMVAPNNHGFSY